MCITTSSRGTWLSTRTTISLSQKWNETFLGHITHPCSTHSKYNLTSVTVSFCCCNLRNTIFVISCLRPKLIQATQKWTKQAKEKHLADFFQRNKTIWMFLWSMWKGKQMYIYCNLVSMTDHCETSNLNLHVSNLSNQSVLSLQRKRKFKSQWDGLSLFRIPSHHEHIIHFSTFRPMVAVMIILMR